MTDPLVVYPFFSFVSVLLAVSNANLKSSVGKSTQYYLVGSVYLKTSNTWGFP